MAEPSVRVIPQMVESATARFIVAGEFCQDGACFPIRNVMQMYFDIDGFWVRGWFDILDPVRSDGMDGMDTHEGERMRLLLWRMVHVSMP